MYTIDASTDPGDNFRFPQVPSVLGLPFLILNRCQLFLISEATKLPASQKPVSFTVDDVKVVTLIQISVQLFIIYQDFAQDYQSGF